MTTSFSRPFNNSRHRDFRTALRLRGQQKVAVMDWVEEFEEAAPVELPEALSTQHEKPERKMISTESKPEHVDPEVEPVINAFSRSFMNPMVKVTIKGWPSSPQDPFHLHRDILMKTSEYFRGCLSSGLKESQTHEIDLDLEQDYREAFGYFVEYAYSGTYTVLNEINTSYPVPFNEEDAHELGIKCGAQALLHTWVYLLGEQLLSDGLKKVALAKLRMTLLAAYLYPHPSGAGRFQYPGGWTYWNEVGEITDYSRYREFCHDKITPYGLRVPYSTCISGDQLAKAVGIIYENTPPPPPPPPDADPVFLQGRTMHIRRVVTRYMASCFEELRMSQEIMDLVYGNREVFEDVMGYLSNGRTLNMIPARAD